MPPSRIINAHPDIAKEHEADKVCAATLRPDNLLDDNDARNDWIKRAERNARRWRKPRG